MGSNHSILRICCFFSRRKPIFFRPNFFQIFIKHFWLVCKNFTLNLPSSFNFALPFLLLSKISNSSFDAFSSQFSWKSHKICILLITNNSQLCKNHTAVLLYLVFLNFSLTVLTSVHCKKRFNDMLALKNWEVYGTLSLLCEIISDSSRSVIVLLIPHCPEITHLSGFICSPVAHSSIAKTLICYQEKIFLINLKLFHYLCFELFFSYSFLPYFYSFYGMVLSRRYMQPNLTVTFLSLYLELCFVVQSVVLISFLINLGKPNVFFFESAELLKFFFFWMKRLVIQFGTQDIWRSKQLETRCSRIIVFLSLSGYIA